MANREFTRSTPAGTLVEFSVVNPIHVGAVRRDTEDHAFHVTTAGGRIQLVLVRIDALAGSHVPADEVTIDGQEIAIRHILRCIDEGSLPRGVQAQATEVIHDIRPLLAG